VPSVGAWLSCLTVSEKIAEALFTLSQAAYLTYWVQVEPAEQVTDTEVPVVAGVQELAVSTQYLVAATPDLASVGVRVTVTGEVAVQLFVQLSVTVGATVSPVLVRAVAVVVPALFVARIFSVYDEPSAKPVMLD